MADFQKLYFLLFNAFTDVIEQLDRQNYGTAKELLIRAQQAAEEAYIAEQEQVDAEQAS